MFRNTAKNLLSLGLFAGLVATSTAALWVYERRHSAEWQIQKLEADRQRMAREFEIERQHLLEQKQQLQTIVQRLGAEKRVAEVLVTDQQKNDRGVLHTELLF